MLWRCDDAEWLVLAASQCDTTGEDTMEYHMPFRKGRQANRKKQQSNALMYELQAVM